MPAPTKRDARLAQKLRANLARRKQQVRGRASDSGENGLDQETDSTAAAASPGDLSPSLDRDDPPA